MVKILTFIFFISCTNQQNVKSISASQLTDLLKKENIQLIDIRTTEEFIEGNIKGAKNINFFDADFINQIENTVDKTKPVYIYCKSGNRSLKAYNQLEELDFEVYHLKEGYQNWKTKNN